MSPIDKAKIRAIAERYGARNIRVFGSVARGDDRPDSDLDLLIDLEEERSLLDLIAIQQDLEDLLGRKVDVVTEGGLNRYLKDDILREAIPL
jgi:predicted nucleotidyltransferase